MYATAQIAFNCGIDWHDMTSNVGFGTQIHWMRKFSTVFPPMALEIRANYGFKNEVGCCLVVWPTFLF
jgi:hypothetical protein